MSKKSEFTGRPNFSVAMSQETGCIVMVKTLGTNVSIMGSLTREQSLEFAKGIINWRETIALGVSKAIEKPKLTLVNGS